MQKAAWLGACLLICAGWTHGTSNPQGWFTLKIGGGGFADGISISSDGATMAVRGDTGYCAVSTDGATTWQVVTGPNNLPAGAKNGSGTYECRVAPSDKTRIWLFLNGFVYRSDNSGASFTQTAFTQADTSMLGSNTGGQRLDGPRMAVDPINPDVVYLGTPAQGLYVTTDAGTSWNIVTAVPPSLPNTGLVNLTETSNDGTTGITFAATTGVVNGQYVFDSTHPLTIQGNTTVVSHTATTITLSQPMINGGISASDTITFATGAGSNWNGYTLIYDPSSGTTGGKTNGLYVSPTGSQVFKTLNAGGTWSASSGGPTTNRRLCFGPSGTMWFLDGTGGSGSNTGLWTYTVSTTTWAQIQTSTGLNVSHQTVSCDPNDANHVTIDGAQFITVDGGTSFFVENGPDNSPAGAGVRASSSVRWMVWTFHQYMSPGDAVFDPVVNNKLWLAEGIGVWSATPPLTQGAYTWTEHSAGIESLVSQSAITAVGVPGVLVSNQDRPLFKLTPGSSYPSIGQPNNFSEIIHGWDVKVSSSVPSTMCALINNQGPDESGCSMDGGVTWSQFVGNPYRNTMTVNSAAAATSTVVSLSLTPKTLVTGLAVVYDGISIPATATSAVGTSVLHFGAGNVPAYVVNGSFASTAGIGSTGLNVPQLGLAHNSGGVVSTVNYTTGDVTLTTNIHNYDIAVGELVKFKKATTPIAANTTVSSFDTTLNTVTLNNALIGNGLDIGEYIHATSNFGGGSLAVATPLNIVWLPNQNGNIPWYTKDGGVTWNNVILADNSGNCSGGGSCPGFNADGTSQSQSGVGPGYGFFATQNIKYAEADRVDGTLYIYNCRSTTNFGGLFASLDGGDTWVKNFNGLIDSSICGQGALIRSVPGNAGHLFFSGEFFSNSGNHGSIIRSQDHGVTWTKIPNTADVQGFGYGAPKPGNTYPAFYFYGSITGTGGPHAVWRSDNIDTATVGNVTWTQVTDSLNPNNVFGSNTIWVEGDMNIYGRVYLGISGKGWLYGQFN